MGNDYKLLVSKLNLFIKQYYKNQILRGIIYSLTGLISILIVFSLFEHFGFFNSFIRSFLFWAYCLFAAITAFWFIVIPAGKMWRLTNSLTHKEAAKIIGNHFGDVADKLTNILELHNIHDGNAELIHASINQKIEQIKNKI